MAFGDLVQSNEGTSTTATTSPTFSSTPTSGNLVVLTFAGDDYNGSPNSPWLQPSGGEQQTYHGGYLWYHISNGTNSYQYTIGSASPSVWTLAEYQGPFAGSPLDSSTGTFSTSDTTELNTGSVTPATGDTLAVAAFGASSPNNLSARTATFDNSFTTVRDIGNTGFGTNDFTAQGYRLFTGNGSTSLSTTGTMAEPLPDSVSAIIAVFKKGATGTSVNVTGQSATASVGTVTVSVANTAIAVTGQSATSGLGTVTFPTGSGKPTFVDSYQPASNWTTAAGGTTRTTSSFNVLENDILVLFASSEDEGYPIASVSGGSLTWTLQQDPSGANYCDVKAYTAVVDSNKSMTVSVTSVLAGGDPHAFGFIVHHYRDSSGVGATAGTQNTGAPSLALTTTAANSAISCFTADWSLVDGTTRTWRTINSITPTAGNGLELVYFATSGAFSGYSAYWDNTGTIAAKTTGLTAPSGQKYRIVAVEVKGGNSPNVSVNVVGNSATTVLGNVSFKLDYKVTATGSSATATLGSEAVSTQQRVSVTGSSATSGLGTVTFSLGGGVSVNATGNAATSAVGTVQAGNSSTVSVTGVSATTALGSVATRFGTAVTVSASALTASLGSETVLIAAPVNVTGQSATASLGTIIVEGFVGNEVTGLEATASVSSVTLDIQTNAEVEINDGVEATASVGNVLALDPVQGQQMLGFVGTVDIASDVAFEVVGLEMVMDTSYPFLPQWAAIPDSIPNVWIEIT